MVLYIHSVDIDKVWTLKTADVYCVQADDDLVVMIFIYPSMQLNYCKTSLH